MPGEGTQPTGGAFQPPEPAELQSLLPGYEVLELLGRGGMGAVYKARHLELDRLVAIKIFPYDPATDTHGFAERFQREARAMAKFHHLGIVAVHEGRRVAG